MAKGPVKWFSNNKGFGFIQCDEHGDVFVHFSDIQIDGYKTLSEGQMVEYELVNNEKGLMAKNVKLHLR
jgi:CspA family cold shock protein